MKYYIATTLSNHVEHNKLRDALNIIGHEITYDWTIIGPAYKYGLEKVREVAIAETKGILDADFVVVLWPGGRGTHVELGMAIAANKSVIFISNHEPQHQATTETCAFYHHPLVQLGYTSSAVPGMIESIITNLQVNGLFSSKARLEKAEAYIKKMDGLLEEIGNITVSCINPYEDLKRSIIALKKRAEEAEFECSEIVKYIKLPRTVPESYDELFKRAEKAESELETTKDELETLQNQGN